MDGAARTRERLRISTECFTCYHWLPPILADFQRCHPSVRIRIVMEATRQPLIALKRGDLELAIMSSLPGQGFDLRRRRRRDVGEPRRGVRPEERCFDRMGDEQILIGLTHMLLLAASRAGVSPQAILAEVGVDERELADRDGRLPFEQHRRIGEAVLARISGERLVAMVGELVTPAALGVVGRVMQNSATFRDALDAFIRYQRLVVEGTQLTLEPGGVLVARVPPNIDALRHPVLAMFAMWLSLGRSLTETAWRPVAVTFALPSRSGEAESLEAVYGVRPRFGADRHSMQFDGPTLALPIVGARPDRQVMLRAYVETLMDDLGLEVGLSEVVCRQLVTSLAHGDARQTSIARALGMSARTLSRRLHAEGTTLGALLERVRRELARRYLRDESLAVYEVAFLLGYREPSTFFRAFKRWTGETPRSWRASPS